MTTDSMKSVITEKSPEDLPKKSKNKATNRGIAISMNPTPPSLEDISAQIFAANLLVLFRLCFP
jgi:hypothetical protein